VIPPRCRGLGLAAASVAEMGLLYHPVPPEYSIVWFDLLLRLRACLSGG
jgi:hypothetical protein